MTGHNRPAREITPKPKERAGGMAPEVLGASTEERYRLLAEQERQHRREIEYLNNRLRRAMQETHHRVKNNLQIINSLLEMQIIEGRDTIPTEDVRRVMQHVGTLAMIHDLLTEETRASVDVSHISLRPILEKLIAGVEHMLRGRKLILEVEDVSLPIQQVTALSLLVNECLANAVWHGAGDITLTLRSEGNLVRLRVGDCGCGFPYGFDPTLSNGIGTELMESAVRWDLQGDIVYHQGESGGACVEVTFPLTNNRTDI